MKRQGINQGCLIIENHAVVLILVNIPMITLVTIYAYIFFLSSPSDLCFLHSLTFNILGNVICVRCEQLLQSDSVQLFKHHFSMLNGSSFNLEYISQQLLHAKWFFAVCIQRTLMYLYSLSIKQTITKNRCFSPYHSYLLM